MVVCPRSLAAVMLGVVVAVGATGCGDGSQASDRAAAAARSAEHSVVQVAAYRAGQFCHVSREARYRRFGLTCEGSHLHAR